MGRDKLLLPFRGRPLVFSVLDVVQSLFKDVYLVGTLHLEGFVTHPDVLEGRGSLIGIHTALQASKTERVFVCAGDLPFLSRDLIRHMSELPGDVVIPFHDGHYEPLCALYDRACIPWIEAAVREERLKASSFHANVQTTVVDEPMLRRFDPSLRCFLNVNTPEDYASI